MNDEQKPTHEFIERWAIKMAMGNNGGTWATHYTEDQKNFWREKAARFTLEVALEMKP